MATILYGNWCLVTRSGTEVVTLETALGLQRLGDQVAVFVSHPGPQCEILRQSGIPVLTSLESLPWRPDLIHCNHLPQSLLAALRFPDVPQIYVCHDPQAEHSAPPRLPQVRRYLAVDEICAERMGTVSSEVTLLPNAVDIGRFGQRPRLPERPRRALLLSKTKGHLEEVKKVCQQFELSLDTLGVAFNNEVDDLPQRLMNYDLVFAVARTALEAMAVGCAVIVVDERGLAGMVTPECVDSWRQHNFGKRLLTRYPTAEALSYELEKYNVTQAQQVSERIRKIADLDDYLQNLRGIYNSVITESKASPLSAQQSRAHYHIGFYAALPDLIATETMQGIAYLATGLPEEHQNLWRDLCRLPVEAGKKNRFPWSQIRTFFQDLLFK
jgi:hypothetical protein